MNPIIKRVEAVNIMIIEKFLNAKMEREEREEFKRRMLYDGEFRSQVENLEIILIAIRNSARQTTLEEKLQKLQKVSYCP